MVQVLLYQKTKKAKELLDRTENEWRTYTRLYKSKSVSELDLRSKKQAYQDALASYQISINDQEKVKNGLSKLYVRSAEENVAKLKTKIIGLERDLKILQEERKFYKIVTPYDGIIKTNSDTVHLWDNAGTAAAVIHKVEKGFYIYSYFEEKDVIHIKDGIPSLGNDGGMPLGRGEAPVAAVYQKALAKKLPLIVESETLKPSGMDEITVCLDYLKSLEG